MGNNSGYTVQDLNNNLILKIIEDHSTNMYTPRSCLDACIMTYLGKNIFVMSMYPNSEIFIAALPTSIKSSKRYYNLFLSII